MSRVTRRLRGTLSVHRLWAAQLDEAVVGLQFAHGGRIAAVTASGSVWIAAGSSGGPRRLGGHDAGGLCCATQPGGTLVASGGQDGLIRLWDAVTAEPRGVVEAGAAWVERVAWRPDGSRFAAATGRRVAVWDAAGVAVGRSAEHASTVADIAWQPDGGRIATAAYGGAAFLTAAGAGPQDHVVLKGSSLVLAWQPQGRYLAVGNQDATVLFVIVETADTLQMWGFPSKVRGLDWSSDGRFLATASGTGLILWDASGPGPKGRTPAVLEGHFGFVTGVAWQPRGPLVASAGDDAQVCIFAAVRRSGIASGRPAAAVLPGGSDESPPTLDPEETLPLAAEATAVAWSPGGGLLAAADRSGGLTVWRVGIAKALP
jgi:WD40 repeat protein